MYIRRFAERFESNIDFQEAPLKRIALDCKLKARNSIIDTLQNIDTDPNSSSDEDCSSVLLLGENSTTNSTLFDGVVANENVEHFVNGTTVTPANDSVKKSIDKNIRNNIEHSNEKSCIVVRQTSKNIDKDNFVSNLKHWAVTHNVNHSQLQSLLQILIPYHPQIHRSSKTILGTVRSLHSRKMLDNKNDPGDYIYFGIQYGLNIQFNLGLACILTQLHNNIELVCNIDGLPIFKSTNQQFWPILGKVFIKNFHTQPFVIALFKGNGKPKELERYLADFIDECNSLRTNGFSYEGNILTFTLKCIISDAPARSFLKCIKPHNSFYSCERCHIRGCRVNNRFLYIGQYSEIKRTNDNFLSQEYSDHHLGTSPLTKIIDFDTVYGVPLDSMHMGYLGIMRRLLNHWVKTDSKFRISPTFRQEISNRLLKLAIFFPREFNRKPRSLSELDRWKATEFRTFLVYIGPFILKGLLPHPFYKHFMLLHCAFRIACSYDSLSNHSLRGYAISTIKECCRLFELTYPEVEPVYNSHSVLHLVEECINQNMTLDEVSCFPFENYLGYIKKLIRTPNKAFAQVSKRLLERDSLQQEKYVYVPSNVIKIYKETENGIISILYKGNLISSLESRDQYVLIKNDKVMKVKKLVEEEKGLQLIGQIYQDVRSAFDMPIDSKFLRSFKIKELSSYEFKIPITDIITKCMVFSLNDGLDTFAVGLLHEQFSKINLIINLIFHKLDAGCLF